MASNSALPDMDRPSTRGERNVKTRELLSAARLQLSNSRDSLNRAARRTIVVVDCRHPRPRHSHGVKQKLDQLIYARPSIHLRHVSMESSWSPSRRDFL